MVAARALGKKVAVARTVVAARALGKKVAERALGEKVAERAGDGNEGGDGGGSGDGGANGGGGGGNGGGGGDSREGQLLAASEFAVMICTVELENSPRQEEGMRDLA